jgi:hypothetical protein
LIEFPIAGGRAVRLCDFGGAGADDSAYRSWLKVEHVVSVPFDRNNPRQCGPSAWDKLPITREQ